MQKGFLIAGILHVYVPGIANEKWSRAFFGELQNVSGQHHYEQEGVLEGQFTLNGQSVDFSLPCVRDHSFGKGTGTT